MKKPQNCLIIAVLKLFTQNRDYMIFQSFTHILEHVLNCRKVTAETGGRKTHVKGQTDSFNGELKHIFQRRYEIL